MYNTPFYPHYFICVYMAFIANCNTYISLRPNNSQRLLFLCAYSSRELYDGVFFTASGIENDQFSVNCTANNGCFLAVFLEMNFCTDTAKSETRGYIRAKIQTFIPVRSDNFFFFFGKAKKK